MAEGMNDFRCRMNRATPTTGNDVAYSRANHRSDPTDLIKRSATQPRETTPIGFSPSEFRPGNPLHQGIWLHSRLAYQKTTKLYQMLSRNRRWLSLSAPSGRPHSVNRVVATLQPPTFPTALLAALGPSSVPHQNGQLSDSLR